MKFLEEWLADIGGNTENGSDNDQDEEAEEVDTILLIDVDETASLPQEETTVTQQRVNQMLMPKKLNGVMTLLTAE